LDGAAAKNGRAGAGRRLSNSCQTATTDALVTSVSTGALVNSFNSDI
jgi:hypothetical protein